MNQAILNYERRQPSRSNSSSTVNSSIAEESVGQSQQNSEAQRRVNSIEDNIRNHQSHVNIDGSHAIQVGDIYYNIYLTPSKDASNFSNWDNVQEDVRTPSPATTEDSLEDSMEKPKLKLQLKEKLKQKRFIALIVLAIMFVGVITSVILVVMNTSGQELSQEEKKTTETTTEVNTVTTDSTTETTTATEPTTSTDTSTEPIESTMSFDTTATTTKETTEFTTVTKPTEPTTSSHTTTISTATTSITFDTTEPTSISTLDITLTHKIITRSEWNAIPPKPGIKKLRNSVSRIIVAHTANLTCFDEVECKQRVKAIQTSNDHLMDIPFNFLIGGDGNIYVGRGFDNEGQHTANPDGSSYNDIGICVAFIGTFDLQPPSELQLNAFEFFIENFMSEGNITESFYLFSQDQLAKPKIPADALTKVLEIFENFHSVIRIYRRDEWDAKNSCRPNSGAEIPMRHLILTHIESAPCTDFASCASKVQMVQNVAQGSCIGILSDIQYGFLIGGDGLIFEGRGFDLIGDHTHGYDQDNLGIAFIGNFDINEPSYDLIENSLRFFNDALTLGKLSVNYQIHARQDIKCLTGPGANMYREIQKWLRYRTFWD